MAVRKNVNILMVMRVVGWLMLFESAFMLIPLATALIYSEQDYRAFLWAIAITAATGSVMAYAIRPHNTDMAKREGFLLTALVWVVFSTFGMIPFLICERFCCSIRKIKL